MSVKTRLDVFPHRGRIGMSANLNNLMTRLQFHQLTQKMVNLAWKAHQSRTPLSQTFPSFGSVRKFLQAANGFGYEMEGTGTMEIFQFACGILENEGV